MRTLVFSGACLSAVLAAVVDPHDFRDYLFFAAGCGFGLFAHWLKS